MATLTLTPLPSGAATETSGPLDMGNGLKMAMMTGVWTGTYTVGGESCDLFNRYGIRNVLAVICPQVSWCNILSADQRVKKLVYADWNHITQKLMLRQLIDNANALDDPELTAVSVADVTLDLVFIGCA